MDISKLDLAGLSEPLGKLVDALRSAGWTLYEPTALRRIAQAEADALITRTRSEIYASELHARAASRVTDRELRRQVNLERIVTSAAAALPETVSADKVDPDWMAHFLQAACDTSNEEIQAYWASLLAGQIARPGKFSRRTIEIIRVLEPEDAAAFVKVSRLTAIFPGGWRSAIISLNDEFVKTHIALEAIRKPV